MKIKKNEYVILIVVLILGFALRFAGFRWGGHSIYQPDEVWMVSPTVTMVTENSYTHDTFYYPAQSFAKIQALLIKICSVIFGKEVSYMSLWVYWLCRLEVVIAGTMAIAAVFYIGNMLMDKLGTISAILVAVSPIMINMSKQDTGDINVMLCGTLTMLFALKYSEKQQYRYLILMSLTAAMGMMEKWHGGIDAALVGIFVLIYTSGVVDFIKRGFIAFLSFVAGLVIIAPNMFLQLRSVIIDNFFGVAIYDGAEGPGFIGNLRNYIGWSYEHIGGFVFVGAILIGLVLCLAKRDKRYLVLLLGVMKLAILCTMNRSFARWGLEFYLTVIILASIPLAMLFNNNKKYSKLVGCVWTGLIGIEALLCSLFVCEVAVHGENDVRAMQEAYCEENGINLDNSVSAYYTGYMPGGIRPDGYGPFDMYDMGNVLQVIDGNLVKKVDADYYIYSSRSTLLSNADPDTLDGIKIWEIAPVYSDISILPYAGLKNSMNDIILLASDIEGIRNIKQGTPVGNYRITIYDISELEKIDE